MKAVSIILIAFTWLIGAAPPQDSSPSFEQLEAEFNEQYGAWRSRWVAASQSDVGAEQLAKIKAEDPMGAYLGRFQAGAKVHRGTDAEVPYLVWIFTHGSLEKPHTQSESALGRLMQDYPSHPDVVDMVPSIAIRASRFDFDRLASLDALALIAEACENNEEKASALYWIAYIVKQTASTEEEYQKAIEGLVVAIETGSDNTKKRAKGMHFEYTNLRVGMVAPDIEGEDLGGAAFKLSDYKGRVVLLDFWGDW